MSTRESILIFIISALLVTAAAIHGYVVVMVYLDERKDKKQKLLEASNTENRRN